MDTICKDCGRTDHGTAPCMGCVDEPRASVMPPNMQPIDPLFVHGVFNEFEPDEKALMEKERR